MARILARVLTPSCSDFFFICSELFGCSSGGQTAGSRCSETGDRGGTIRTFGQYILEHSLGMPTSKGLFSFSRPGAPWFAWEYG